MFANGENLAVTLSLHDTAYGSEPLANLQDVTLDEDLLAGAGWTEVGDVEGAADAEKLPEAWTIDESKGHGSAEVEEGGSGSAVKTLQAVAVIGLDRVGEGGGGMGHRRRGREDLEVGDERCHPVLGGGEGPRSKRRTAVRGRGLMGEEPDGRGGGAYAGFEVAAVVLGQLEPGVDLGFGAVKGVEVVAHGAGWEEASSVVDGCAGSRDWYGWMPQETSEDALRNGERPS